ncbi:S-adenosyl-L-methionine-dependent methyltransferase [Phycomyces nitens]|nr:S-adenosyl-L-methionine-dependent methyltransferase [Phycomyces nitens]
MEIDTVQATAGSSVTKRKARSQAGTTDKRLKTGPRKAEYFTPDSEEVIEDENLEVMGEQAEDEDVSSRTLPMRTLDNFVLYDVANKRKIYTLDYIGEEKVEIRASGNVKAIYMDTNDEDEVDEGDEGEDEDITDSAPATVSVQLSCIFFWQVYMNTNGESEIWLQTQYGWYKLGKPSEQYKPYYDPTFARVRISNVAEKVLTDNEDTTYNDFLDALLKTNAKSTTDYSIDLTEKDVETHIDYVIEELTIWADEFEKLGVMVKPLMQRLASIQSSKKTPSRPKKAARPPRAEDTSSYQTVRNMNREVLENPNPTCVTPHVATIAKDMFVRRLIKIKEAAEEAESMAHKTVVPVSKGKDKKAYRSFTDVINWKGEPTKKEEGRTYYETAEVDGEVIKVGDCVYLRNDTEEPWFARIMYMFEDPSLEDKFMFHARYFSHGRDTIWQEFSGKRELVLLDSCSDNVLSCVMGKCQLTYLGPDEREPVEFAQMNWWFYRYWYNPDIAVFEDVKLHETDDMFNKDRDCQACESCDAIYLKQDKKQVQNLSTKGYEYNGHTYHINDFVYITTDAPNTPYQIGQIVSLNKVDIDNEIQAVSKRRKTKQADNQKSKKELLPAEAHVRVFERSDQIKKFNHYNVINETDITPKDARSIIYTDKIKTVNVSRIEGKCWVEHTEDIKDMTKFKEDTNAFHVSTKRIDKEIQLFKKNELKQCIQCKKQHTESQGNHARFMESGTKLVGLDIFSGCGGLTCGMDMTGVVDTKYAIEFSPSASISFEKNFSGSVAYNQCANVLLERAIALHGRKETPEELKDHLGRPLQPMPAPGEVDFIYCGPPCQGFSGINRFKKADDIKNTLVCTALSYVDFYKPKYFLLENVRGLVSYKLGGEQAGQNRIKGGIEMGVVKYILRCLTSMGYQTRFSIQQAGHHGVAQSRRRLFIWGAKIGNKLPDFPQPMTCFPKPASLSITLPDGHGFSYMHRTDGQAPLAAVTVGDSISELPEFEYKNTNDVYPETDKERKAREESKIPQLPTNTKGIVGHLTQSYVHPPLTDFQNWIRLGADQLANHFTRDFNSINIERIYNIKMSPGSDHSSLPEKLKPWCLSHKDSAAGRHNGWKGLYGRLDFEGQFSTTLTEMSPMGKQGTIIHPNQRRVLSVREYARAQGFPDRFVFYSTSEDCTPGSVKDMYRQIGNAVPVPLAFALGKELRAAMQEDWLKSQA